jgi:large subunit ribosomal protein L4
MARARKDTAQAGAPDLTVGVLAADGTRKGTVELPAEVFAAKINVPVMHLVVRAQRAAARAGTHSTRTRSEVRGGGRKPWRQKGTGRARQGSIRAPQWTGGGVVFGPHPRDYTLRVNKKQRRLALRSALSDRHAGGDVLVLDALEFDAPRTKRAVELLARLELGDRKLLLVVEGTEDAAIRSFRNLPKVHLLAWDQLNTYDVLYSDTVVFTRGALDAFLRRGAGSGPAAPPARGAAEPRTRAPARTTVAEPEDDELVLEEAPAVDGEAGT